MGRTNAAEINSTEEAAQDYSWIRPGDILCIKHINGGFHVITVVKSGRTFKDILCVSGNQRFRNLRDEDDKFSREMAIEKLEKDGYKKEFLNEKNYRKYSGFGTKIDVGDVADDYIHE